MWAGDKKENDRRTVQARCRLYVDLACSTSHNQVLEGHGGRRPFTGGPGRRCGAISTF